MKYSLTREGFRLKPIPPLEVVRSRDGGTRGCGLGGCEEGEEEGGGVFQPGSGGRRGSLKRDGNVVPVRRQRTPPPSEDWRERHNRDFR